ncbi:ComF family protein [Legionella sp. CNM-4043-24]|uniref:ComF family protein n=1 Tax=Legionella sp. CNM-4043-24 TaxID=3421646 RepID=UPI00403A97C0
MRQTMANMAQWLRLPAVCALCRHYHNHATAVCKRCHELLIPIRNACGHCALPLADSQAGICGQCIRQKPYFDRVLTSWYYEEPLRSLLHEFKYQNGLYLRTFFTDLMMQSCPENYQPDCLIPVPMHPKRLRQRGFNQALELSKLLGKRLAIPVISNLCQKIRNTEPQAGLDARQRHRNLNQAFEVKPNRYQHVSLIDDLVTTGSTANELARSLKASGITQVDIWCLARTAA